MVNSAYDPRTGAVHAFEEQIGSHGGLGGEQGHPFLMWPAELPDPGTGEELAGAEAVHAVLRRWLREADGPQVPVAAPLTAPLTAPLAPPVERPAGTPPGGRPRASPQGGRWRKPRPGTEIAEAFLPQGCPRGTKSADFVAHSRWSTMC